MALAGVWRYRAREAGAGRHAVGGKKHASNTTARPASVCPTTDATATSTPRPQGHAPGVARARAGPKTERVSSSPATTRLRWASRQPPPRFSARGRRCVAWRLPRASPPEELTTPGRGRPTENMCVDSPPPPKKRYTPPLIAWGQIAAADADN